MSVNVGTVNQMTKLGGRLGESEGNPVVILIEGREFDLLGVGQWAVQLIKRDYSTKAVHCQKKFHDQPVHHRILDRHLSLEQSLVAKHSV